MHLTSTCVRTSGHIVCPSYSKGVQQPRKTHCVVRALADHGHSHHTVKIPKVPQPRVCLQQAKDLFLAAAVCTSFSLSLVQPVLAEDVDPSSRCTTVACKELYERLALKKAAEEAGEPIPDFKLTKEERRQRRVVERARMEEQNREFAKQKMRFAREERAYLLKYRAMEEEAKRLEQDDSLLPIEEKRALVEAAGAKAFETAMVEQRRYEREQGEFEERLAARRAEAAERQAAADAANATERALKKQEEKFCKTQICT
uniref:Uncharacterized protein n=1 Tax=Pyramimonas obovata TaxID=1411642 RepID=A0A7S0QYF2_9CHLO|mmetsp:Transcript_17667/g.38547  ORF Transcript_17667/g.38547 Transcript_17667/m.38547 type:complete len:258 (+) Transcript_17667:78-851(+)|eukprot:CAMPEP_0118925250 /NCGR_PEP_ID=MMETSP1169-20130426/3176_1 /TAXON_ID=36882 /ORGANISM="Pyramimonas obovata, Strain CCMP722" /LENGTH=257 /DNA_ID=CAMNT_0006866501 /DNA_START=1 /DNA_END=774 /DNA_ORIENTATION=-